jgi:HSP20 family protein
LQRDRIERRIEMSEKRLVPWEWHRHPWEWQLKPVPLHDLRERVDHLFDELLSGFHPLAARSFGEIRPRVDMSETDKQIRITIELPGLDEEDVEILLSGDRLTVKGEKKLETEEKDQEHYLFERSYGAFRRTFTMPPEVDAEKVKATFAKGVLTVTLPKTAVAAKPVKKVAIGKAGAKKPAAKRAAKKPASVRAVHEKAA